MFTFPLTDLHSNTGIPVQHVGQINVLSVLVQAFLKIMRTFENYYKPSVMAKIIYQNCLRMKGFTRNICIFQLKQEVN